MKNQEADPGLAFKDEINNTVYGDNPLAQRLKIEDLAKVDYARIMEMYQKQFSNPGSFVFTFVGNIDEEQVKPIIEQYLASLPGRPQRSISKKYLWILRKVTQRKSSNARYKLQNLRYSLLHPV